MNLNKKSLNFLPQDSGPTAVFLIAFVLAFTSFPAWALKLPANYPSRYDDYDREKYQDLVRQREQDVARAKTDLDRGEERLRQAQAREVEIGQALQKSRTELQNLQAREIEIQTAIEDNQEKIRHNNQILPGKESELTTLETSVRQANQAKISAETELAQRQTILIQKEEDHKEALRAEKLAQTALEKVTAEVSANQNQVVELRKQLESAPEDQKPTIQAQLDAELQKLSTLLARQSKAKEDLTAVQNSKNLAKIALDHATKERNETQLEVNQASQHLQNVTKIRDLKKTEVEKIRADNQELLKRNEQLKANQIKVRQDIATLSPRVIQLENNYREAQANLRQRLYERDSFVSVYNNRVRDLEESRRYLVYVEDNIERARAFVVGIAREDGVRDGDREGRELGEARGNQEGTTVGNSEGLRDGERDGRTRDYNKGYAAGSEKARQDARVNSARDAEAQGKIDGEWEGRRDGLAAAYRAGYAAGESTANDSAAYQVGRKKGEAEGLRLAIEDAKPQEKIGFDVREKQYRSMPLKDVIVGDAKKLEEKFKGLQGRYSDNGDDRYYSPRANQNTYPHQRILVFYIQMYDTAYRSSLDSVYPKAFAKARKEAYDKAYPPAYQSMLSKYYPDSEQNGYKVGYDQTYKNTYEKLYNDPQNPEGYPQRKAHHYKIAFDIHSKDKNEYKRGFDRGNADASELKGFNEGKAAAYAANIEIEKKKAYEAGIARADQKYQNNAILDLISVELRDEDGDQVYRPGESIYVLVKIKNFGLVSKTDLSSFFESVQGVVRVTREQVNAGQIPPQSNATVIVPLQAQVDERALDGQALSLVSVLKDSKETLARNSFKSSSLYPVSVDMPSFDGILIPGEPTPVKVRVQNRSRSPQNLKVQVLFDGSRVEVSASELESKNLLPGAAQDLLLTLTGKKEAQFEESPLSLKVSQSQIKFARDLDLTMTIIQRHKPTPDSKSLILSGNLALGSGKAMFKAVKSDTWDLRVDGELTAAALEKYNNKIVHVMADGNSAMGEKTIQALRDHVFSRGGVVALWADDPSQSRLISQLSDLVTLQVGSLTSFKGSLVGRESLAGVSIPFDGRVAGIRSSGVRSLDVLQSELGNHAVIGHVNGTQNRVGRVLVVGAGATEMSSESLQKIQGALDLVNLSFEAKVDLAVNDSGRMPLVSRDIMDEIISAESEGGKHFQNNPKSTKMYKAAEKFLKLDKKNPSRQEFTKAYPATFDVANLAKDEAVGIFYVMDLKVGVFSPSWKGAFCALDGNHKLCKSAK